MRLLPLFYCLLLTSIVTCAGNECQCKPGWVRANVSSTFCYRFYNATERELWDKTQDRCSREYAATLAVLKTEEATNELTDLIRKHYTNASTHYIPIGLSFDYQDYEKPNSYNDTRAWIWIDGTRLSQAGWDPMPDPFQSDNIRINRYVYLYNDKWVDAQDDQSQAESLKVCQTTCASTAPVTTTDDSSMDTIYIILAITVPIFVCIQCMLCIWLVKCCNRRARPAPLPDMLSKTGKSELDNIQTQDLFAATPTSTVISDPAASPMALGPDTKHTDRAALEYNHIVKERK